jgi:hypothetical protein
MSQTDLLDFVEIPAGFDDWEGYIRSAGVSTAMLEYGKRWYEFKLWCQEHHGKQGGSMFAQFALERFGMKHNLASAWVSIGFNHKELVSIADKFAPDYTAICDYTKLGPEQKTRLIESLDEGEKIDRKAIKALAYGHDEGDEWFTPKWLFDSLGLSFDMDVCAPADLTYVTTPANKYFNEADDGLSQKWKGLVWCNPPYSFPEPWALKCIEHGNGLLLTHIPMNAEWCSMVWQACDGIRLFQAIEFVRPDGKVQRPGSWLQLAAFGDQAAEALLNFQVPDHVAENPRRVPSPMWVKA